MSDDGNESDADIAEETPPMPAPDAEGDEGDGGASAAGAGGRKKRRSGTVARAPSKAQTKMVHSCIVKVSFVWGCVYLCRVFFLAYLLYMYLGSENQHACMQFIAFTDEKASHQFCSQSHLSIAN